MTLDLSKAAQVGRVRKSKAQKQRENDERWTITCRHVGVRDHWHCCQCGADCTSDKQAFHHVIWRAQKTYSRMAAGEEAFWVVLMCTSCHKTLHDGDFVSQTLRMLKRIKRDLPETYRGIRYTEMLDYWKRREAKGAIGRPTKTK